MKKLALEIKKIIAGFTNWTKSVVLSFIFGIMSLALCGLFAGFAGILASLIKHRLDIPGNPTFYITIYIIIFIFCLILLIIFNYLNNYLFIKIKFKHPLMACDRKYYETLYREQKHEKSIQIQDIEYRITKKNEIKFFLSNKKITDQTAILERKLGFYFYFGKRIVNMFFIVLSLFGLFIGVSLVFIDIFLKISDWISFGFFFLFLAIMISATFCNFRATKIIEEIRVAKTTKEGK